MSTPESEHLVPFLAIPAVAAGLISGGGAVAGGLLARSGSKSIADQQRAQANTMFARTQPAFDQAYNYYSGLLKGDPTSLMTAVGPDLNNTNMFFNQAKNNVTQGAFARGGGLTAGLTNVEGMRALSLSNLVGTARQSAAPALANLATGNQTQALQALAGAQQSNTQNSILQSNAMDQFGGFLTRLLSGRSSGGGGSNYFGVPFNTGYGGIPPAAIVPSTGSPYPGYNDPWSSNV